MKIDWLNEKENLERLIKEGVSYERLEKKAVAKKPAVKKAAKKLGIELEQKRKINPSEHFNKGTGQKGVCLNCGKEFIIYKSHTGKYCSHSCQLEYQYKEYIKNWKEGKEDGMSGSYGISEYIRRYLFEKYDGKCRKSNGAARTISATDYVKLSGAERKNCSPKRDSANKLVYVCGGGYTYTELKTGYSGGSTYYTYEQLNKTEVTVYRSRTKEVKTTVLEPTVTGYILKTEVPEGYTIVPGSERTEYSYKLSSCGTK